jgi:CubicO group peptidase (beta-lactamase class C family)
VIAAMLSSAAPAAGQADSRIDAIVEPFVPADAPGCSVAVGENGRTTVSRSYGRANLEHAVLNAPATRFETGSIAKQFTAAAILLLAQDGRLSLQDDVRKYIPELPDHGAAITVDHLLTHMSGLRDITILHYMQGWFPFERRQFSAGEELRDIVRQRHLNFRPGTGWSYSNSGYVLAALIVERVAAQPFRTFLRERIFHTLGMASTEVRDDFRRVLTDYATPYGREGGEFVRFAYDVLPGAGGIVTTAEDLLVWNAALDTGRLGPFVTAELQREARTTGGRAVGYARGLEVSRYRGAVQIGHGGSASGVSTMLLRYPQRRLSIAILCNGPAPAPLIARRIADLYLPPVAESAESADAAPRATQVPLTAEQIAPLTGVFVDDFEGLPTRIRAEAGSLKWGRIVMEPLAARRFRLPGAEILFTSADAFELTRTNGERLTFRRVDGPHPSAAQLTALAGRYRSEEAATTYEAVVEEGKLVLRVADGPDFTLQLNAIGPDLFENDGDLVRFVRNRRGAVAAFLFTAPRLRDLRFERMP